MSISGSNIHLFDIVHQSIPPNRVDIAELGNQRYNGRPFKKIPGMFSTHTSFDLNGRDGAIILDLSKPIPAEYRGRYNTVTNFGTSEHILDQAAVFRNMHEFCAPEGFIIHSVPLSGYWKRHSPWKYTKAFFEALAVANAYSIIVLETVPRKSEMLLNTVLRRGSGDFVWNDSIASKLHQDDYRVDDNNRTGIKTFVYADYDEYAKAQIDTYEKKKDNIWCSRRNIGTISDALKQEIGTVRAGLCHGVRTGAEVRWFRQALSAEIVGTDIGGDPRPDVVIWDFNSPNPDWLSRFDFVYSNAFDHAFDPRKTMMTWRDQLRVGGRLCIEIASHHERPSKQDPVGASKTDIVALMRDIGLRGVHEIALPERNKGHLTYQVVVIGTR